MKNKSNFLPCRFHANIEKITNLALYKMKLDVSEKKLYYFCLIFV